MTGSPTARKQRRGNARGTVPGPIPVPARGRNPHGIR